MTRTNSAVVAGAAGSLFFSNYLAERAEHGQVRVDAGCFQRNQEQASEAVGHGWRARALSVIEHSLMSREVTAATAT